MLVATRSVHSYVTPFQYQFFNFHPELICRQTVCPSWLNFHQLLNWKIWKVSNNFQPYFSIHIKSWALCCFEAAAAILLFSDKLSQIWIKSYLKLSNFHTLRMAWILWIIVNIWIFPAFWVALVASEATIKFWRSMNTSHFLLSNIQHKWCQIVKKFLTLWVLIIL